MDNAFMPRHAAIAFIYPQNDFISQPTATRTICKLFKETIFAKDIFRGLIVLEELVNEVGIDRSRFFGHSFSCSRASTLLVYDRLHNLSYTLQDLNLRPLGYEVNAIVAHLVFLIHYIPSSVALFLVFGLVCNPTVT